MNTNCVWQKKKKKKTIKHRRAWLGERSTLKHGGRRGEHFSAACSLVICSIKSLPFSEVREVGTLHTVLLINIYFFFSDFFGVNALCMQAVVPGTYIYEHCTSNDECLDL